MERAFVQPEDVPVPLRALEAVIKDWRVYCEEHYSIFVLGETHACDQDSCELFSRAHQFYGCRVCGNHHVCRRQVCSAQQLQNAQSYARTIDELEDYLGLHYGYWCAVQEVEPGLYLCRISGHTVHAGAERQPDVRHSAMLRENSRYALDDGTVTAKRPFQFASYKPPTSLSRSTPVMSAARSVNGTALTWNANAALPLSARQPKPKTDSVDEEDGDGGDEEDEDRESSGSATRKTEDEDAEYQSDGALTNSALHAPAVIGNTTLMNTLARTSSPRLDRKRATAYFEALDGLVNLHISTFQGPLKGSTLEPPFKRPASAPLLEAKTSSLPTLDEVTHTEREALESRLRATIRKTVRHVHTYWMRHEEIAQEERERTYDPERTLAYCLPLLMRLLILLRRHRSRLRYIHQANAPRSLSSERRRLRNGNGPHPRPIPGMSRLAPPGSVWVDVERDLTTLLLRSFSEPLRLRDTAFETVHVLWEPDPFLAEAASHGVLEECIPSYTQGAATLTWVRWMLRTLDLTPAYLHDCLWKEQSHPKRRR